MYKVLLAACFIAIMPFVSHGQGDFKIFFEKVYVQTDRNYYTAGEDLWFKAYLVNAQTGIRINTSNILYVELISPTADLVSRKTILMQNGLGQAEFSIPANAASGNYRIRAYTNWMKNFGDLYIFEKVIEVAADPEVKAYKPARYNADFVLNPYPNAPVGKNTISFFPEGGNLLAGVNNQVAFKSVSQMGVGLAITGKIVNSNGDSVAPIKTSHAGLGSFSFTPVAGVTYKALGKYATNEMFEVQLPQSQADGFAMHVSTSDTGIIVNIYAGAATRTQLGQSHVSVIARHTGKKIFSDSTLVFSSNQLMLKVPKRFLPPGISIITLYDDKKRPWCERLFFTDDTTGVRINLETGANHTGGQASLVNIEVKDKNNKVMQARLSLAATDADIIPDDNSSIVSYLQLESEIKGDIENPVAYFDIKNPLRLQQMDILLQTQGWRQFLWRRLLDTSLVIKYMPEPGITLSGKVQKLLGKKGLAGMDITLYAEKSKADKIYMTKTDADGRYFLDGLQLYGRQDVRVSSRNSATFKREGEIFLDSVYNKPWPIRKISDMVFDTSAITHNFWQKAAARKKTMVQDNLKEQGQQLENVTVTAKRPGTIRLAEEMATRFGADSFFNITTADTKYRTVENYVLNKYPGAFTNADQDGFFFYGDGGARIRPRWVINGEEDRFGNGNSMNIDETTGMPDGAFDRTDYFNIAINKVKSINVSPAVTVGNRQLFVIYLTLLPGALDQPDFSIINAGINGYYEAREYFEPSFKSSNPNITKSDLRSTIFWAPVLQTDANGKAIVNYTDSPARNIRITVEGVTDSGIPVAAMMLYKSN